MPIHHKKEKLRTAKNIIDKIVWDEHLNKEDFRRVNNYLMHSL